MTNVRCLLFDRTPLSSVDLALFADIKRDWIYPGRNNVNILFEDNPMLKSLTTSVTDKVISLYLTETNYIFSTMSKVESIDKAETNFSMLKIRRSVY